jgi:hypothetical protein
MITEQELKTSPFIRCHECERGGNGSAKDKCSAGWDVKSRYCKSGCFQGERIEKKK